MKNENDDLIETIMKEELKHMRGEINMSKMLFLILFVVTCVMGSMMFLHINFIYPFLFSLLMFVLNWYSLIKQINTVHEYEMYDKYDSN